MKTEIGGDRLGSGNKQEVSLRNYERSSHDLGYIWRSSMASGTLVPFLTEVALPGDSFDIDLDVDVKTLPTVGPLFGSYKVQLDVFQCPIRLYNGKLHMNMLNIGMDMSQILLPQLQLRGNYNVNDGDNQQINSSSIYSYLNMRGLGKNAGGSYVRRYFNAIPYLGYWDIYKNYYANKQEERGFVIHGSDFNNDYEVKTSTLKTVTSMGATVVNYGDIHSTQATGVNTEVPFDTNLITIVKWAHNSVEYGQPDASTLELELGGVAQPVTDVFGYVSVVQTSQEPVQYTITCKQYTGIEGTSQTFDVPTDDVENTLAEGLGQPQLTEFPLDNIDDMRMDILEAVRDTTAFQINSGSEKPYGLGLAWTGTSGEEKYYATASQEGLGIKTYRS
jgi:hypothetical protein